MIIGRFPKGIPEILLVFVERGGVIAAGGALDEAIEGLSGAFGARLKILSELNGVGASLCG